MPGGSPLRAACDVEWPGHDRGLEPHLGLRDGIRSLEMPGRSRSAPIPTSREHRRRAEVARVRLIAYVNHDIDDAVARVCCGTRKSAPGTVSCSARARRSYRPHVTARRGSEPGGGLTEIRKASDSSREPSACAASWSRRSPKKTSPCGIQQAGGILGGLWEKVRERRRSSSTSAPSRKRGSTRPPGTSSPA